MSLVRVQSEEPELEKPAQGNLSGLFAFVLQVGESLTGSDVNHQITMCCGRYSGGPVDSVSIDPH